jgi:hypothetical protein
MAGALAGAFAGLLMAGVAMALATAAGYESVYPLKLPALPFLGGSATALGFGTAGMWVGLVAHELLAMFLGAVFAHFAATNYLPALLGAGLSWGIFSWIFLGNLFFQSFDAVNAAQLPRGASLICNLIFGLGLTSVGAFDRMFKR